jgi:signal transduction histidine kinase
MLRLPLPSLRQDRVLAIALILLAVAAVSSLLPVPFRLVGNPLAIFAALLAVALRPRGESRRARAFWGLIGAGLAFFLTAQLWQTAAQLGLVPPPITRRFELLYVGRYLFLVMALEMRPDLPRPGRSEEELRQLDTIGAVLFLFSLIAYVMVSPSPADPTASRMPVSPRVLFMVLDVFLVLRALGLSRQSRSPHWQAVYGWLAAVIALRGLAASLAATAGTLAPFGSAPPAGLASFVPLVPLIIAARLRPGPETAAPVVDPDGVARTRLAPLVAYTFALPIFHFFMERLAIVEDETAGPRALVVLAFLSAAAVLLWVYQRVLVRENRRLEAERQAMAEQAAEARRMDGLGRLAGGVAHDFNNVLTVIRGRTELMLVERGSDPQMKEDLEAIRQAARRGEGVTRQLLAFGRRQILRPEVLDVGKVVSEVAPLLRSVVSEEVRLVVTVRDDAPWVVADPGQVEMALLNLAVNAREAMPGGGQIDVEVDRADLDAAAASAIPQAREGSYVVLTVRDTGQGMDDATLARIFDPFFTTKAVGAGAGLGLPAVHGFVKQSGGAITVTSSPGRGATFRIYLPRVDPPALAPDDEEPAAAAVERG